MARWLAPSAVMALGQLATVAVLVQVARAHGRRPSEVLLSWDSGHFREIALHGYAAQLEGVQTGSIAFFPGFPLALRAATEVTGWSAETTGTVVSLAASLVLAHGLVALTTATRAAGAPGDRTSGLVLVGLVSTAPTSVVLSMAYSEALFMALVTWCLVELVRERWIAAGLLCGAAGLVRSPVIALIAAFGLTLAVTVLRALARDRRASGRSRRIGRLGPAGVRAIEGGVLAPVGLLAWFAWCDQRYDRDGAYFVAQSSSFDNRYDFGLSTLRHVRDTALGSPSFIDVAVVVAVGATAVLLWVLVRQGHPLPLVAYAVLGAGAALGSERGIDSRVRWLLPVAVVLLVPLARWVRQQQPLTLVTLGAAWVAAGTWWSAYVLVVSGAPP